MVMLLDKDIQTKEVSEWEGLHLFHFSGSTCSQKVRIFLGLKGIAWESHHLNLAKKENQTPWYMGINPRGLVPTLVYDGKVIIESNDILEFLETEFPEPALIPADKANRVHTMLKAEDDLHLDIRALTMRFLVPLSLAKRPEGDLVRYDETGSGTVRGEVDPHKQVELTFWRDMNNQNGITDAQTIQAYDKFKAQLEEYDEWLKAQTYLLGEDLSVVDIAWYIYSMRLINATYPLHKLHPNVGRWFNHLNNNPIFRGEVPFDAITSATSAMLPVGQEIRRSALESVVARQNTST